jgi:hypothetical protein
MAAERCPKTEEAHQIYDRHANPVEDDHRGEYALVTPDGKTVFAPTLVDIELRRKEFRILLVKVKQGQNPNHLRVQK